MKNILLNSDQSKNIKKMLLCAVTATVMLTTMIFTGNVIAASNKSYVADVNDSAVTETMEASVSAVAYNRYLNKVDGTKRKVRPGEIVKYPASESSNYPTYQNDRNSGCSVFPCYHMVKKIFRTQVDAAKDYSKTYGKLSIKFNQEYATTIYKIGPNAFTYAYAEAGEQRSSYSGACTIRDTDLVSGDADIHSHGNNTFGYKFSGPDIAASASATKASGVPIPIYVSNMAGQLRRVQATKDSDYYRSWWFSNFGAFFHGDTRISNDMPHAKWDITQLFKFKHWGRKRCGSCA